MKSLCHEHASKRSLALRGSTLRSSGRAAAFAHRTGTKGYPDGGHKGEPAIAASQALHKKESEIPTIVGSAQTDILRLAAVFALHHIGPEKFI